MQKILLIIAIVGVSAGAGFFGGVQYKKSKSTSLNRQGGVGAFQSMSGEQRQLLREQFGAGSGMFVAGGRNGTRGSGNGFVAGEIIAKDDSSVTVKLPDGGSKIIFFSSTTSFVKNASGTPEDLIPGESVVASGTANQDGSLTAQSIQLRSGAQFQARQPVP